jgi:hypothetical protein
LLCLLCEAALWRDWPPQDRALQVATLAGLRARFGITIRNCRRSVRQGMRE